MRELGLFSLQKRRLRRDPITLSNSREGGGGEVRVGLSCRDCSERTRGEGLNLRHGTFRLDIREKKKITVRVVRHWNRSP